MMGVQWNGSMRDRQASLPFSLRKEEKKRAGRGECVGVLGSRGFP